MYIISLACCKKDFCWPVSWPVHSVTFSKSYSHASTFRNNQFGVGDGGGGGGGGGGRDW